MIKLFFFKILLFCFDSFHLPSIELQQQQQQQVNVQTLFIFCILFLQQTEIKLQQKNSICPVSLLHTSLFVVMPRVFNLHIAPQMLHNWHVQQFPCAKPQRSPTSIKSIFCFLITSSNVL